jgi:hypothetical protein
VTTFQPSPGATLECDIDAGSPPEQLRVLAHPAAPRFAHAAEGGEGTVFQVERVRTGVRYALKVFKPARQSDALPEATRRLRPLATMPGLRACERFCLDPATSPLITSMVPALRFAIVMPWIDDPPWLQTIVTGQSISAEHGLAAARSLARCLLNLEDFGAAHGDLSGGNVLVHPTSGEVSLVDVEALYAPGLPPPRYTVLGTPGYNLVHSTEGVCTPGADRFAAAILLGELLGWHDPRVRAAASTCGSYFAPDDIAAPTAPRFTLLRAVLAERSPKLAALFGNAWYCAQRSASPAAHAWVEALDELGTGARHTQPLVVPPTAPVPQQPAAFPGTQVLQGPPQIPLDVLPAGYAVPSTVTLSQSPALPDAVPPARPLPTDGTAHSPVAFWRALKVSPRDDNPVVGWSSNGPLTPKRFREP